ncbi:MULTISPECIES: HlyC/CorC family transporter [Acinetobacter]|jgi:magnesium and cobalt transporter|uniref:Magnesium and cobalt efflux protein CorC n=1 Tax=Acinetobacter venetianus TaxID=52133 RepID=A0A150HUJ7_9GAMM|nr:MULTISPECIES: CBS domain-containing protein [Acinetobacter]MDA0695620.1 CBS domain-containing protein [Pseudomonadota bacterium]KXO75326.1 magnesium/cobalt efflux protein [Acinetobacter venetianus]KXO86690.1 magnesium/cobalt efflux protein [Acinetobacter venetianus]KXZ63084.1 Magnesium and cobalt efflux protein CorC [Acinetobacter venetianus]KXZ70600.1 Magnesium and cobalt efflux protein CorC [Acinetobacter venetianus]
MVEESSPSWGMRGLRKWLGTAPETRDELLKLVQNSRRFLEPDTVAMLEGVLDLPATKIREVMTPRTAIISLQEDDQLFDILDVLIESAHSRFPVFSADQSDNVVGILLAKDLLPFLTERNVNVDIRALMRQPVFVPESARSDQVLRMLKNTQTHIAIVIDEYGSTSGLVTLEDILEEIVGEIEDEHDIADEEALYIVPDNDPTTANTWIVQALTPIEHFNTILDADFSDDEVETMGGLLLQEIGLVSDLQGQTIELGDWQFTIIEADARTIHLIRAVRQ